MFVSLLHSTKDCKLCLLLSTFLFAKLILHYLCKLLFYTRKPRGCVNLHHPIPAASILPVQIDKLRFPPIQTMLAAIIIHIRPATLEPNIRNVKTINAVKHAPPTRKYSAGTFFNATAHNALPTPTKSQKVENINTPYDQLNKIKQIRK